MFRPFADWLSNTPLSMRLAETVWVIPTSQSLHIIGVAVVFTSACMINLRLLGISKRGRSLAQLSGTLIKWMWRGLALLLLTGVTQTIAEPVRQFVTPAYWAKMCMIVVVALMTSGYARAARRHALAWEVAQSTPPATKVFAMVSTLLWIGIIVCGRFIGYIWTFYL